MDTSTTLEERAHCAKNVLHLIAEELTIIALESPGTGRDSIDELHRYTMLSQLLMASIDRIIYLVGDRIVSCHGPVCNYPKHKNIKGS